MNIQNLNGVNSTGRTEKSSSSELRDAKVQKKGKEQVADSSKSDQVEISSEAKELLKSSFDEPGVARDLLSNLPSTRAHVIYAALAKVKAGLYSSDEIVEEAAAKLLNSGELNDVVRP